MSLLRAILENRGSARRYGCLRQPGSLLFSSPEKLYDSPDDPEPRQSGSWPWLLLLRGTCTLYTARRSISVDFHHGFGKGTGGFLWQVVPDTALDDAVCIFGREFLGIRAGGRVRRPIGIAFKGDGGHGDDRSLGEPLFQIVVLRLAFRQAEPPAVVMDYDADMIRVFEGRCAAVEGGIVELPLW